MTIMQMVDKYVKQAEYRVPIYTNEVFDYVKANLPNADRAVVNMTLQRYEQQHDAFVRYRKGIYFKAVQTPFGYCGIDETELIRRAYISDGEEIIGYESGPSYMNKLGLTTQMPAFTYIVTTKARYSSENKGANLYLLKPVTKVNKENFKYLQFLDILENKMRVKIEVENYIEVLRKQIKLLNLSFEKLIWYARYYKSNRVYTELSKLAREAD